MTTPNKAQLVEEANREITEADAKRVTVLFGDYGKRKTTTAASMINEKGLLLSSDDSHKVLFNSRHSDLLAKTKIVPLTGISQLAHIDFDGYDTIIWDTVSQTADAFLDLLYDEAKWAGNFREKIISNNPQLKDVEALGFVDYRVTRDTLRPAFNRLFRECKAHIIFTSQMTEPIPGMGKDQRLRPSIPAATFKVIGTRADIIGQMKPGTNGKFKVDMSEGSLTVLGKSRIEGLQGSMDSEAFVAKYKEIVFK
jgi:hypothetical protein